MSAGRPVSVYTPERLKEIEDAMNDYTEKTAIPILAEFAFEFGILREEIYKHPELNYARKMMLTKKEVQLEKGSLTGKLDRTVAIFSLKQLGWSDKHEHQLSGSVTSISKLSDEELERRIKDLEQSTEG